MKNLLIRGVAKKIHVWVWHMSAVEQYSVNRYYSRLLDRLIESEENQKGERERIQEAFRRIDEIREEIYRKYGTLEDSTPLIREDRDSR